MPLLRFCCVERGKLGRCLLPSISQAKSRVQDDLVCLPHKAAAALGGFGPLALCTRVSNTLTLTDPQTLRAVQMDVSA